MTLLCVWLYSATTDYFRELHDSDVRLRMYQEQKEAIEADMAPFGFVSDGLDDETFTDDEGDRWDTNRDWNVDEYGDRSYMWDYR